MSSYLAVALDTHFYGSNLRVQLLIEIIHDFYNNLVTLIHTCQALSEVGIDILPFDCCDELV
jgi:hypothetical protein